MTRKTMRGLKAAFSDIGEEGDTKTGGGTKFSERILNVKKHCHCGLIIDHEKCVSFAPMNSVFTKIYFTAKDIAAVESRPSLRSMKLCVILRLRVLRGGVYMPPLFCVGRKREGRRGGGVRDQGTHMPVVRGGGEEGRGTGLTKPNQPTPD